MTPSLSVIICTHNPRRDYLERVLGALRSQTLPRTEWELLVIDNASAEPVSSRFPLTWHEGARHIVESELGLTPARLRGISEASADLLVFVDDDNVLDPPYLERALEIARDFPFLGAWGGTILPEFETSPPDWTKPMWGWMAIRSFDSDVWSNHPMEWRSLPCGAGLCVRRVVGQQYRAELALDHQRRMLDRRGRALTSTGDTDLILTARAVGLGWGNFSRLTMTHLIPSDRLTEDYLLRLREGMSASETLLAIRRNQPPLPPRKGVSRWVQYLRTFAWSGRRAARFYLAYERGSEAGFRLAGAESAAD